MTPVRVRAARPQDRSSWCELAGRSGPEAEGAWWDRHVQDPSWRLLVAENGRIVGKTAARLLPGVGVQVAPPRVRGGVPVAPVAAALLESAMLLRQEGPYPALEFKVSDRVPGSEDLRKAAAALRLTAAGERVLFERDLQSIGREPFSFACRTHHELGDEWFLPAFEKVERESRPKEWRASDEWEHAKRLPGFDPKWAFLATKAGESLGYVVTNLPYPAGPDGVRPGTISYLGVLPEKRRQGFGALLHNYALHALRRRGATHYRAGIPVEDGAGLALARRAGCREVGREWLYRRRLTAS